MTDETTEKHYESSRSSRPVVVREFTLKSEQAQRVFRRNFQYVDHHAFSISIISRAHGNHLQADKAEQALKQEFERIGTLLQQDMEKIKLFRNELGISEGGLMSNPQKVKAEISANLSMEYLQLLRVMDEFLCLFEPLVILGEIDYDQRQSITYEWQRKMTRLARVIRHHSDHLRKIHQSQKTGGAVGGAEAVVDTAVVDPETDVAGAGISADIPMVN